jgi:MYXO-CTERM domain-containing protein
MHNHLVTIALLGAVSAAATAERVDLFVFENADGADVSGLNLWADVVDKGSYAEMVFHNDSTIDCFVRSIYIENTDFSSDALDVMSIQNPQPLGVKFKNGGSPPQPAGSIKNFGGDWQGNLFAAKANKPGSGKDGIDSGEHLVFEFDYSNFTFQEIIDALTADVPAFRIAQHVQGLPGGFSVWTMNDPEQAVPLPSAAGLSLAGIAALGLRRRR